MLKGSPIPSSALWSVSIELLRVNAYLQFEMFVEMPQLIVVCLEQTHVSLVRQQLFLVFHNLGTIASEISVN